MEDLFVAIADVWKANASAEAMLRIATSTAWIPARRTAIAVFLAVHRFCVRIKDLAAIVDFEAKQQYSLIKRQQIPHFFHQYLFE